MTPDEKTLKAREAARNQLERLIEIYCEPEAQSVLLDALYRLKVSIHDLKLRMGLATKFPEREDAA